jgi:hypothetical protein
VTSPATIAQLTKKTAVLSTVACSDATTSKQFKPDAEPKTVVSAKTFH